MIARLVGEVVDSAPGAAVIDVGGVGYEVSAPSRAVRRWMADGAQAVAHVVTLVREDAITLHGFDELADRAAFRELIAVTGVGARLAHALLEVLPAAGLARAIETEDVVSLSRVPGIGKKTAQRLVLELKGKLGTPLESISLVSAPKVVADPLVLALAQLEYGRTEIDHALAALKAKGLGPDAAVELRLREALRVLSVRS